MKTPLPSPARFRPLLPLTAIYLVAGLLLRAVLWASFGRTAGSGWLSVIAILPLGAVNDLCTAVVLLFPLTLFLTLAPRRLSANRLWPWLTTAGATIWVFATLYLSSVEYFFFEEFNARFNLVAVDYLIYPHEVFINIWQSYPVIRTLLACGVVTGMVMAGAWRYVRQANPAPLSGTGRRPWSFAALHGLALLLVLCVIGTDSLALSQNRVNNEIIANGISSLFRAFHTNELDYTAFYPTLDSSRAFTLIHHELADRGGSMESPDPKKLCRRFPAGPGLGRLNVVVVVEESLGAQFVGAYGDNHGLTPNIDRLAGQGLLFANAFASGTRTVRGLEAIVTSIPPIPSEGIIKRPGSWPMANWGEVLRRQGYHPSFQYGGYGLFDNMNPFFGGNGFELIDRHDIDRVTFSNIWGVCDQDLFTHALGYFDREAQSERPFFSVIMTTSNHSPYTFPAGIPGVPPTGGDRPAGIRYADFALGEFMDRAAQHPWYRDTLFVIVADHDARVYGREQIPLQHYRIPLLVLAPGRLPPRVVETTTGQIDIAPTVMGLLGLGYEAPFYGQDVLGIPANQPRPVLLNHDHDVGLLLGDRLVVLGLQREVRSYRVARADDQLTPISADPLLTDLATAYFQTAFELFQGHGYQLPRESTALAQHRAPTPGRGEP